MRCRCWSKIKVVSAAFSYVQPEPVFEDWALVQLCLIACSILVCIISFICMYFHWPIWPYFRSDCVVGESRGQSWRNFWYNLVPRVLSPSRENPWLRLVTWLHATNFSLVRLSSFLFKLLFIYVNRNYCDDSIWGLQSLAKRTNLAINAIVYFYWDDSRS